MRATTVIVTAALLAVAAGRRGPGNEPAATLQIDTLQQAVGQALRALVDPDGRRRAEEAAAAKAQAEAQAAQRKQQIQQMEQAFQPAIRTELEMVRQTCGRLSPEDRRALLAASREAGRRVAEEWVGRQARGDGSSFDARERLHELIAAAVEGRAPPADVAAYGRETSARKARREEAARLVIVARLDEQLDLTEAQREAILADLRVGWQESWGQVLNDNGVMLNNRPVAPDFAAACVAPHLDADQQQAWQAWAQAASSRQVNLGQGMRFDGQGLQQADEWWSQ